MVGSVCPRGKRSARRVTLLIVLLYALVDLANGKGILFPIESETRERKSLDGIWNFRLAPRNDPDLGFREEWFKSSLSDVSQGSNDN